MDSDYSMQEYTTHKMIEYRQNKKAAPPEILENFITSVVRCYQKGYEPSFALDCLYRDLEADFVYDRIDQQNDFARGAIYGALEFYKKYLAEK